MADDKKLSEKLEEQFTTTEEQFKTLADKAQEAADRAAKFATTSATTEREMSMASLVMRDMGKVAPAVREAMYASARQNTFLGSKLQQTSIAVAASKKEHDIQKANVRRLTDSLGSEATSIRGIMQLNAARAQQERARAALAEAELKSIQAAKESQQKVVAQTRDELTAAGLALDLSRRKQAEAQSEITTTTATIQSKQAAIVTQQQEQESTQDKINLNNELRNIAAAAAASYRNQITSQESLISATEAEIVAKDGAIATLTAQKTAQQSQLSSIQASIDAENARYTATLAEPATYEQRARIESHYRAEMQRLTDEQGRLTSKISDLDDAISSEVADRAELQSRLIDQQNQLASLTTKLQEEETTIADLDSEIATLNSALAAGTITLETYNTELKAAQEARKKANDSLEEWRKEEQKQITEVKRSRSALAQHTDTLEELTDSEQEKIKDIEAARQKALNEAIEGKMKAFNAVAERAKKISTELNKLVDSVFALSKQFGISAGSAAKLKFENIMSSAKSVVGALTGQGPAVSTAEIEATQGAFQAEFGGVLTSTAAKDMAAEAKRMGVGASELAKARRVFMTQTMGDTGQAKAAQDKFVAEFAKKGLTSKDAMEAIGKNSELLARNGTRFATSFARAAAEAKKIGVDLSKVDQVGDNIIGDFEGFLEKQAELGAMGFNFDSSRLAEIAETGDTGALFEELQSQLAAQGKDLTKLRRSEQLAISQAYGLSMEDIQKMAAAGKGGTEGSGEETLKPEELQKDANSKLGTIVFILQGAAITLGAIASGITLLNRRAIISRLFGAGGAGGGFFDRMRERIAGGGTPPGGTPPVPPGGTPPVPPGPGSRADEMVPKDPNRLIKGAAAMVVMAGALYIFAKAVQEFMKTDWSAVGKAVVSLAALTGAALLLDKVKGQVIVGAAAMVIMGGALWIVGKAVQQFSGLKWETLAMAGVSLVGIGLAAAALGAFAPLILLGSAAMAAMGVAFGIFAFAVSKTVGPLVTALQSIPSTLRELGAVLNEFPIARLLAFGAAALLAAPGIAALGVASGIASAAKGIGSFVGGVANKVGGFLGINKEEKKEGEVDTGKFSKVADTSAKLEKVDLAARNVSSLATAMAQLGQALQTVDVNKLNQVTTAAKPSVSEMVKGAVNKVAGLFGLTTKPETAPGAATTTPTTSGGGGQAIMNATVQATTAGKPTPKQTPTTPTTIPVDTSRLEAKLDAVVRAIGSMQVKMDGKEVGKVLVNATEAASQVGVFRNQSRSTL